MNDSTAVPAPPPQVFSPAPIPKKDQEDLNLEVYEKVFKKCMAAADRIIQHSHDNNRQVQIAIAIFDRFYSDQASMKQAKQQAEAMMAGFSQILEGRR